jgi:hypothetical protein
MDFLSWSIDTPRSRGPYERRGWSTPDCDGSAKNDLPFTRSSGEKNARSRQLTPSQLPPTRQETEGFASWDTGIDHAGLLRVSS